MSVEQLCCTAVSGMNVVTNQTRERDSQHIVSPAATSLSLYVCDRGQRTDRTDKTIKTRQTPDRGISPAISWTSHLTTSLLQGVSGLSQGAGPASQPANQISEQPRPTNGRPREAAPAAGPGRRHLERRCGGGIVVKYVSTKGSFQPSKRFSLRYFSQ